MKIIHKLSLILCLIVLSVILSYQGLHWIAETFFFDRLFYQKSVAHGYFLDETKLPDFGDRTRDLVAHLDADEKKLPQNVYPGFRVVLIGDSFLWGQGVRHEHTVTALLEKNPALSMREELILKRLESIKRNSFPT